MPGKKGQVHSVHRQGTMRSMGWQSMRIKRRFTIQEITVTVPEGKYSNLRKWARMLAIHGYIKPVGETVNGRAGDYQAFRLARGMDRPKPPMVCDLCGKSIQVGHCKPEGVLGFQ